MSESLRGSSAISASTRVWLGCRDRYPQAIRTADNQSGPPPIIFPCNRQRKKRHRHVQQSQSSRGISIFHRRSTGHSAAHIIRPTFRIYWMERRHWTTRSCLESIHSTTSCSGRWEITRESSGTRPSTAYSIRWEQHDVFERLQDTIGGPDHHVSSTDLIPRRLAREHLCEVFDARSGDVSLDAERRSADVGTTTRCISEN